MEFSISKRIKKENESVKRKAKKVDTKIIRTAIISITISIVLFILLLMLVIENAPLYSLYESIINIHFLLAWFIRFVLIAAFFSLLIIGVGSVYDYQRKNFGFL